MAYAQGWDPSAPDGAITPAADIDVEIQNTKVAIGERLVEFVPEWADDLKQPKKIAIVYGEISARPATPDFPGELYFATDTGILYIANGTPEWVSVQANIVEEGDDTATTLTYYIAANKVGDQSIAAGAWTPLSGWAVALQNATIYTSGQPTRFTAPAAGVYDLFASIVTEGSGHGQLAFRVNGGPSFVAAQTTYAQNSGNDLCHVIGGLYNLSVGDYVEVCYYTTNVFGEKILSTYSHVKIVRLP